MKLNLKGVIAGTIGAVMAASTLLVPVMAANTYSLSDYPQPFITDGKTNMLIVVGADASPADVVGAINIAVRLGSEPSETKTVATAGGQQTITEGVDLGLSGDLIYLRDSFSKDTLTKTDMPTILADGTFTDDDGTNYDYTQSVVLGKTAKFDYVKYDTDKDPELIIDLSGTSSSNPLYILKVTFSKAVAFNSTKSEGQTITLFGKDYTIAPDTDEDTLVLYGASQSVTLNKDEETTVTVDGTDYTIKVIGFDTGEDKVILSVNGNTNDVKESHSKKIGGLDVYAKSVTAWDQGNAGIAILQLGSKKLTFEDRQPVQEGEDNTDIEGTKVSMTTDASSLSTLEIKVFKPDSDNDYIAMGSDNAFADPVFGSFKITFAGVSSNLTADTRDQIKLRTSGDKKAYVTATDKDGNTENVYIAYLNATNDTQLLDDDQKLIAVVENTSVAKDEYTFLAPADPKYTHMVKVKKIYTHTSKGYAEFTDVFSGATYKTVTGPFSAQGDTTKLNVDGKEYIVTLADNSTDNKKVAVAYDDHILVVYPAIELKNGEQIALTEDVTLSLTGDINITLPGSSTAVDTSSSLKIINITNNSAEGEESVQVGQVYYIFNETDDNNTASTLKISVDGGQDSSTTDPLDDAAILVVEEQDRINEKHAIVIPVKDSNSNGKYIEYDTPVFTQTVGTGWRPTENDKVTHYVDYYGTFVVKDTSDSDHTIYTLYYPDEQMYALVGAGSEVSVGGGTGTTTYEQVVPIMDNIARLDTDPEIETAKTEKNLILVGGPAVNRLTAQALGLSYPSYGEASTIPENAAVIKLVNDAFTTGKVALIVAGWEAENTQAACSVLQKYDYDEYAPKLTGTAVKVTGTTSPTLAPLTEGNQTE